MDNALDEKTLNEWVDTKASESETLEFKSILPSLDDKEKGKHELLKDISAMSNASGGTIVYGMNEKEGQASGINAIQTENADAAIRRLGQCIEAGIEPRMTGIRFNEIPISTGGYVLAIFVPRSFTGPHRVTFNGKNAFYLRHQRHIAEYSYAQLREAFTLRAHAEDRLRAWRAERLMMIKAGRTPRPIWKESKYVIHILPIVSFAGDSKIDVATLHRKGNQLLFGRVISSSDYFNLDGLVAAAHINREHDHKYVQLFRNGALETVGFAGLLLDDRKIIPSVHIAMEFREALLVQLKTLLTLGIAGPVAVAVSWLSVGDHKLGIDNYSFSDTDRDDLELPEAWVESIEDLSLNVDKLVRPVLDILWQCFNEKRCPLYDDNGQWEPK